LIEYIGSTEGFQIIVDLHRFVHGLSDNMA